MRHALGILGVLAAGVLLAVSAAMNWRFGLNLGRTEIDGQIYGAASAAADCLKALLPFFLASAIRNRMWSQAVASVLVWVVVTSYSLTSAFGHAALNRGDVAGKRAQNHQVYADLRNDLKRAEDQLSWVPQHRPAQSVQADIDSLKNKRMWGWTEGCTSVKGKSKRRFCDKYLGLVSEMASAKQALVLEERIAGVQGKLATSMEGGNVLSKADPQAEVLADLTGVELETVQLAMVLFVALLLEVGSGLGMYVAFSQWRLNERHAPAAPRMKATVRTAAAAVAEPSEVPVPVAIEKPRSGANDNKSGAPQRRVAPENDVERFYKEKIETKDGSSLTATALYEDYCEWCEAKQKEPLALPTFGREFGELGVEKAKIAGRIRYKGIALRSGNGLTGVKNSPAFDRKAA